MVYMHPPAEVLVAGTLPHAYTFEGLFMLYPFLAHTDAARWDLQDSGH